MAEEKDDKKDEEKFEKSPELEAVMNELIETGKFPEAEAFKIKIVFVNKESPKPKCADTSKSTPVQRYLGYPDFVIRVYKPTFVAWKLDWKLMGIIHELQHIDSTEKGEPALRMHDANFCEIPEHGFIHGVVKEIYDEVHSKIESLDGLNNLSGQAPIEAFTR